MLNGKMMIILLIIIIIYLLLFIVDFLTFFWHRNASRVGQTLLYNVGGWRN